MDDASARSLLGNMQARLSRDPYEALGLTGAASHDQVRSAFLQLTKQFHPAKFARLAIDVQRLANEVFLALRGAHDTLAKPSVTPRQTTGQVPVFRPQPPSRPSSPPQNVASSTPSAGVRQPVSPHATTQPVPTSHAPTQPNPVMRSAPPSGPSAPVRPTPASISRPPTAPMSQTTQPMRAAPRAGTGVPDDPARSRLAQASGPPTQPTTPANRAPIKPAPATPTVGRVPTRPTNLPTTTPAAAAVAANTDPKLASIYRLIEKSQFESARMLLEDLVTEKPIPAYKALLHFAKGREAMAAQRLDEARVEIMEALQIVPDHPLAKSALVEMMTRRK